MSRNSCRTIKRVRDKAVVETAPQPPTTEAPAKKKAPAKPRVRVPKKKTSEAK
tara:strand:- start:79 stop:237 length:159 start_codon:yes stop_codon:yes gene_type:complete